MNPSPEPADSLPGQAATSQAPTVLVNIDAGVATVTLNFAEAMAARRAERALDLRRRRP
jgi:hypothetical protein